MGRRPAGRAARPGWAGGGRAEQTGSGCAECRAGRASGAGRVCGVRRAHRLTGPLLQPSKQAAGRTGSGRSNYTPLLTLRPSLCQFRLYGMVAAVMASDIQRTTLERSRL
jgi:hypothetical protein